LISDVAGAEKEFDAKEKKAAEDEAAAKAAALKGEADERARGIAETKKAMDLAETAWQDGKDEIELAQATIALEADAAKKETLEDSIRTFKGITAKLEKAYATIKEEYDQRVDEDKKIQAAAEEAKKHAAMEDELKKAKAKKAALVATYADYESKIEFLKDRIRITPDTVLQRKYKAKIADIELDRKALQKALDAATSTFNGVAKQKLAVANA